MLDILHAVRAGIREAAGTPVHLARAPNAATLPYVIMREVASAPGDRAPETLATFAVDTWAESATGAGEIADRIHLWLDKRSVEEHGPATSIRYRRESRNVPAEPEGLYHVAEIYSALFVDAR